MALDKRKLGLFAVILIVLAGLVAVGSAVSIPLSVTIGADPNPAELQSTIVATAFSGSGVNLIEIYEDDVLVKECYSISTCVYSAVHTSIGVKEYYARAADGLGNIEISDSIYVDFLNIAPVLNGIGDFVVEVYDLLEFTISGYDVNGDDLTYSAGGLPAGASLGSSSGEFSWVPGESDLGEHQINFSVSDGEKSDSELVTIRVVDTKAPKYYNVTWNPDFPIDYVDDAEYEFGITWIDGVAVDSVWIIFDGVLHEVGGDGDYIFAISDLSAGNHEYQWFANDSSGNINQTELLSYYINISTEIESILGLSILPSDNVTYGTETNVSGLECPAQLTCELFRNGVGVGNPDITVLGAGIYEYVYSTAGNVNYSSGSVSANLSVNRAVPVMNSTLTSPIVYGAASDYGAAEMNTGDGDMIYGLYRNGVLLASGTLVSDNAVLGVGSYLYNYTTSGGENYTHNSIADTLVVEKADPVVVGNMSILISPSDNVIYGTMAGVLGLGCVPELTCELFRDSLPVPNPDGGIFSAGVHEYEYNTTGNENYSAGGVFANLTINKTVPDLHLFLNGVEEDLNVTYLDITNATVFSNTSDVELYRNGVGVVNPEVGVLGAGVYNYSAYALENENYTSASLERTLIVFRANSSCFIESNSPQTYPNPVNVTASCTNPEASLQLFRNGTDVTHENGVETVVGAGIWTYNVSVSESENYTFAENSTIVTVSKGTPNMTYDLDSTLLTYNETINVTVSSDGGDARMFRNGTDVTHENGLDIVLGVGVWVYEFNVTGNENYSDVPTATVFVQVLPGAAQVSLEFDKSSPQNYTNSIMATCSVVIGTGDPILYRNGVDVTNESGVDVVLGAGNWTYNCTLPASWNYTAAENVSLFVINHGEPVLWLSILPSDDVVEGTITNVSGLNCPSQLTCELFRDGVNVSDPDVSNLSVGVYEYIFNTTGNENYTSGGVSANLTVRDVTAPGIYFDHPTPLNNSMLNYDMIEMWAFASDPYLANITLYLFNETDMMNETTEYASDNYYRAFFWNGDGRYWFNATAYDESGNSNSTETRTVVIDTTVPSVIGLSVVPDPILNTQTVVISANVSDLHLANVTAEITLPDGSRENISLSGVGGDVFSTSYSNTAQNGTYNARIIAYDLAGNVNDTENVDFLVNYGLQKVINSTVYGTFYPFNFTSDVKNTYVTNTTIIDSTISEMIVNISHSVIDNSQLTNVSVISYCLVFDSVIVGGTCENVYIDPSEVVNSNTNGSVIIDSKVWNSVMLDSLAENSTIDNAGIINSDMVNSNITTAYFSNSSIAYSRIDNVSAINSVIDDAVLDDKRHITLVGANVTGDIVYSGLFGYNNVTVNLTAIGPRSLVYLINYLPTAKLSVVTGDPLYIGNHILLNASESSDPNMNGTVSLALTFNESLNYTYYLGNGVVIVTNESFITYAYPNPGYFTAYVVVSDVFGESSISNSYEVYVQTPPGSGGGGGGGGGGGCLTNWTCGEWSDCLDGLMTRNCTKTRVQCNTLEPRPTVGIRCIKADSDSGNGTEIIDIDVGEIGSKVTGAVTGTWSDDKKRGALVFLLALLIAGTILWFASRRR